MEEEWKPIKEFEGLYEISNFGRVKSCHKCSEYNGRCWPETIMTLQLNSDGYEVIKLRNREIYRKFRVHCLVALHFIEQPEGKDFVNHIDKNRTNNTVTNLEWVTHQENIDHRDTCIPSDEPF